jgi:hypothetical protein
MLPQYASNLGRINSIRAEVETLKRAQIENQKNIDARLDDLRKLGAKDMR